MVANFPVPPECKIMLLFYTCCKQTVLKALNPQSKPPSLQQHSLLGAYIHFGGHRSKRWGQKAQLKHTRHYKKETTQFKLQS